MVTQPLIDAFVMSTDNEQVAGNRELIDAGLFEGLTIGSQVDNFAVGTLSLQLFDGIEDGLDGHHHAGDTAKGFVINFLVLVLAPITDVVHANIHHAFVPGALNDAVRKRAV